MFPRLVASLLDEAIGAALLHRVLRHRNLPPVPSGPAGRGFPGLRSGDPAAFFAPRPEPGDLRGRRDVCTTPHAVVEDFEFASPVATAFAETNVVRGRRWRVPASGGRQLPGFPAEGQATDQGGDVPRSQGKTLVVLDGLVQFGYRSERLFADVLNPAGVGVVTIDLPFNHRRTPRGCKPGQLIVGGDLDHVLAVLRQAVLDVWAAVRALKDEGEDVALAGISFGGWTALAATAAIERDTPGTVSSLTAIAPPIDLLNLLARGSGIIRAARSGLDLSAADAARLGPVARAVTPSAWAAPLPTGRIALHAAEFDRVVPLQPIRNLAEAWSASLTTYPVGHMQLTSFPRWLRPVATAVRESFAN